MTEPSCYDREAFTGCWFRAGYCPKTLRPKLRWRPHLMNNTCKAWAVVGDTVPIPKLEGWDCSGCRWEDTR